MNSHLNSLLDGGELEAVVRNRHVHYSIDPELEVVSGERVVVAWSVRLWAVHAKGARALPGCEKCRELRTELAAIARAVLPLQGAELSAETDPPVRILYDSQSVPGADEVPLTIRLAPADFGRRATGPAIDAWLKAFRARVRELGIREE
jgi:hypothetical protein